MKYSAAVAAALFSATGLAAPAAAAANSQMVASAPQWTIAALSRPCNAADTSCTWSFKINQHNGLPVQACTYTVTGTEASEASSTGNVCGDYTVSSGWSGQFGPGNGFTTLAVVYNPGKEIIYPAYTDTQLASGGVVTPNQSYAPAALPS